VSALLALSLMPGVDAAVASFVHLVHDGHFLHSDAHDAVAASEECPSDCSEDGCTLCDGVRLGPRRRPVITGRARPDHREVPCQRRA
jgi:hypothetical protein